MPETWTTLRVLNWTATRFAEAGIGSARLDAEVLLAHALGSTRIRLYADFDKPLGPEELARARELVRRRLRGEPVAYLVGEQEFWSLPLAVDRRVLVPRRDTETLVEVGRDAGRARAARRVLDVATGSGAVALALARELPDAFVVATEKSAAALEVARRNVARHAPDGRVALVRTDLVAGLAGPFDVAVANPPYIPAGELERLPAEVRLEPREALDGGPDGLAVLRRVIAEVRPLLAPGGLLAVEHGFDQAPAAAELFRAGGYVAVTTTRDLAGQPRVTAGTA